jgi:shikimate dehydrogenase
VSDERNRLAVLGSPISHSKSPLIHRAAYAVLGLDWSYEAVEVTGATLENFVRSRDASWRGLSLTMPLKRDIIPLLDRVDPLVTLVGGANTLVFEDAGTAGFNTDVFGVERSFVDAGARELRSVLVLGAGATAASVVAGVARLGAERITVQARTPAKAAPLVELGRALGVSVEAVDWTARVAGVPDAVVSTLPGGQNDLVFDESVRSGSILFDVAYDPWPSALARAWADAGGTVIPGIDLLLHQAVGQLRIFVGGDPEAPLADEDAVLVAMRSAATAA